MSLNGNFIKAWFCKILLYWIFCVLRNFMEGISGSAHTSMAMCLGSHSILLWYTADAPPVSHFIQWQIPKCWYYKNTVFFSTIVFSFMWILGIKHWLSAWLRNAHNHWASSPVPSIFFSKICIFSLWEGHY